ncbi:hypothetical protein [Azospirillum sp.]|uniref:hypothetical protein n=1 Tax=Azospirillum sp. TaxID=34012 RepID=UPI002D2F0C65|nr:hypothetical protein [Azospirillum sp.]HYD66133.1 hypothetical protein [Azospirillum sp.]
MGTISNQRRQRPSRNIGTTVHPRRENLSRFGLVVWALWPDDPVAGLAQRAKCTKRHASFLIDGKRKPNAKAMYALHGAILGD